MNCEEARRHMLDAEPDALRGGDAGPLALHIQSCSACQAHATTILARTDELRASVGALVAMRTGDEQVAHAAHAARATGATQTALRGNVAPSSARGIGRRVLVPLALAAALATLLLVDGGVLQRGLLPLPFIDSQPEGSDVELYVPQPSVPESPIVNAVGARGVAVMRTSNPKITVVWTF